MRSKSIQECEKHSILDWKQCIDCDAMIPPEDFKIPYTDGSICMPCYLLSVDNPNRISKQSIEYSISMEPEVISNSELY